MGARPFRKQRPLLSLGSSWLLACAAWYLLYSHWAGTQRTGSAAPPPLPSIDAFTLPRLHGRVTKHAPVVGLSQLAALYQGQEDPDPQQAVQLYYPKAWRKERLHGGRPEPPGRLCAVMWNDDLKVRRCAGGFVLHVAVRESCASVRREWHPAAAGPHAMLPRRLAALAASGDLCEERQGCRLHSGDLLQGLCDDGAQ